MTVPVSLDDLIRRFDTPLIRAIMLMGSYSRGEAAPYSDVDFVCFTDETEQVYARISDNLFPEVEHLPHAWDV
ncbi:nucleotidyltransferase domain-containing protein [Dictyobacter formicarum]|uniref:Polymerase nucleotidyl transferase domain-containing protein n=1 Tax=Dictyobacter formicarum TaxID=2778368 RepID=A0ABQ3VNI0_9CHLR|nr:nucleotidyltransferase domain-containing protein [Dictyobacter formicarum]GHO86951.1 hypothetical protein KSZ_49570 [Dictyobacter formicarum]